MVLTNGQEYAECLKSRGEKMKSAGKWRAGGVVSERGTGAPAGALRKVSARSEPGGHGRALVILHHDGYFRLPDGREH